MNGSPICDCCLQEDSHIKTSLKKFQLLANYIILSKTVQTGILYNNDLNFLKSAISVGMVLVVTAALTG
jgi:hypothetical protein